MYNGVPFKQGQTWDDGCDLKCVCENGKTGFYRCSDRYKINKYNSELVNSFIKQINVIELTLYI